MKEKEILEFVMKCQKKGYTPSLREIGTKVGLAPSTVTTMLDKMTRQKIIYPRFRRPRYIRIR